MSRYNDTTIAGLMQQLAWEFVFDVKRIHRLSLDRGVWFAEVTDCAA